MMPIDSKYDCIILGSSPVCMIEALHQSRLGRRVLMIDASSETGGAWRDITLFGFDRVEISTHIMRHYRKGYRYLQRVLGIPMRPMQPEPFWILPKHGPLPIRTPYAHTWNLVLFPSLGRFFSRAGLLEIIREPKRTVLVPILISLVWFWQYIKVGALRARYPVGGAPNFIRQLRAILQNTSVEVLTETTVSEVGIDESSGCVIVETDKGTLSAGQIKITPQSRLSRIRSDRGDLALSPARADTRHLHMLVEDASDRHFSFARFHNDPYYNMISDVSDYADRFRQERPKCKLIAAWCSDGFEDSEDNVRRAFSHAKANKLVGENARLVDYHVSTYCAVTLSQEDQEAIKHRFGRYVEIVETHNLTENIAGYFDRWTGNGH